MRKFIGFIILLVVLVGCSESQAEEVMIGKGIKNRDFVTPELVKRNSSYNDMETSEEVTKFVDWFNRLSEEYEELNEIVEISDIDENGFQVLAVEDKYLMGVQYVADGSIEAYSLYVSEDDRMYTEEESYMKYDSDGYMVASSIAAILNVDLNGFNSEINQFFLNGEHIGMVGDYALILTQGDTGVEGYPISIFYMMQP